jgi:thiol:disulfide interchange protein
MHKYSFLILALISCLFSYAQSDTAGKVVTWQYSADKKSDGVYNLIFTAKIANGWKLFSTTMNDEEPHTRVRIDSSSTVHLGNEVVESTNRQTEKEPLFDNMEIRFFRDQATITIPVQVTGGKQVTGSLSFMAMKDAEVIGPEEVPFRFGFDINGNLVAKEGGLQASDEQASSLIRSAIDINDPVNDCGGTGAEDNASKSLWGIFILGFLGGLIALIMPCTFPMIPLTVSYFTKRSGSKSGGVKNAFLYALFIVLIYVALSIPFYFLDAGSSDILNNISTNAWLNILFAVVFILFALSFFGLFEINLPGNFTNSIDARSDVKTIGGIFFMALTLAIVSFSCTGPILGSLLVGALNQNGGALQLTVAMSGFGLALGLPFGLFALFPNWLNSLPKSGGWMNTVKIVFGFLELAFAIKFISNADLVEHWGILKREVFFAIWIVIGMALVLYLFGILKFKHDPPPPKLGKLRIVTGIFFLIVTLYLVPGVTKTRFANLSLISGFPPPLSYSIYGDELVKLNGVEPHIINDYEKALAMAKAENKPILIDFTGWACVNCRKMEENVWPQPEVKALLDQEVILLSLYVDDRSMLPEDERFLFTTADGNKKSIRTIGDKYSTLQAENFKVASQPYYVMIDPNEKLLTRPVAYMPDASEYAAWLQCGVDAFKSVSQR